MESQDCNPHIKHISREPRYVYVKPKDAIKEFESLNLMASSLPDAGPEAYIAHFLQVTNNSSALIISLDESIDYNNRLSFKNLKMETYSWRPKSLLWRSKPVLLTVLHRSIISIRVFFLLLRFRPTHILCWNSDLPLWISYLAARLEQASFVVSRHNRFPDYRAPWHRKLTGTIDKYIMRHSSAVLCHGPYLRNELLKVGIASSRIFEFNWSYRYLRASVTQSDQLIDLTDKGRIKLVTFVGRIVSYKGVFDLLDACANKLNSDPTTRLVYAGDGDDLSLLEKKTTEFGVVGKVILLGRLRHDKLAGLLRQTTVLVTPTRSTYSEGRCMATIEGLVMGIPVIAPDFGPFRYIVQHGINGLLFKPDSIQSLRRSVLAILDDEALRSKLKQGAEKNLPSLLNPPLGFSEALKTAFSMPRPSAKC
jgi:glycosyltransferase involved in cell wall biosynthesis